MTFVNGLIKIYLMVKKLLWKAIMQEWLGHYYKYV